MKNKPDTLTTASLKTELSSSVCVNVTQNTHRRGDHTEVNKDTLQQREAATNPPDDPEHTEDLQRKPPTYED